MTHTERYRHERDELTPDGRCRTCVRLRQNRWTKTEKGHANYSRYATKHRGGEKVALATSAWEGPDDLVPIDRSARDWMMRLLAARIKTLRSAVRLRHSIFADVAIGAIPNVTKPERTSIRLQASLAADAELKALIPLVEARYWWYFTYLGTPLDLLTFSPSAIVALSLSIPPGEVYSDDFTRLSGPYAETPLPTGHVRYPIGHELREV